MKTRTLLLLAVTCGLVILLAGSIKLFLLAEDEPAAHLRVGESGTAGEMDVTVTSVAQAPGQLLVSVSLVGVDDEDGGLAFELGNGSQQLRPLAPGEGAGAACGATQRARPTDCVLAFLTDDDVGVLLYRRGDQVLRWDIEGVDTEAAG